MPLPRNGSGSNGSGRDSTNPNVMDTRAATRAPSPSPTTSRWQTSSPSSSGQANDHVRSRAASTSTTPKTIPAREASACDGHCSPLSKSSPGTPVTATSSANRSTIWMQPSGRNGPVLRPESPCHVGEVAAGRAVRGPGMLRRRCGPSTAPKPWCAGGRRSARGALRPDRRVSS